MFERLKKLYLDGRIGLDELSNAVSRGWIIQQQMDEIVISDSK